MCKVCENDVICENIKCILVSGCKDLSYCVNKMMDGVYEGMMCLCSNNSYETPICITESPTLSPTLKSTLSPTISPTLVPSNTSYMGVNVEESVKEGVEDYILYFILGGVFILVCILIYFRKKVKECCGGSCNRVSDRSES